MHLLCAILAKIEKFFSEECCCCGLESKTTIPLCEICCRLLPHWSNSNGCLGCAQEILNNNQHYLCLKCQEAQMLYNRIYAVFYYKPPLITWLHKLKFSGEIFYARLMGKLLLQAIKAWYLNKPLPQAIIPVPLSKKRLKTRGYNQALEIAKYLKPLNIPILHEAITRAKETKAQAKLNATKRKHNIKRAFVINKHKLYGYNYLAILDDVVTTQATINALCEQLHHIGIEDLDIWCMARA